MSTSPNKNYNELEYNNSGSDKAFTFNKNYENTGSYQVGETVGYTSSKY